MGVNTIYGQRIQYISEHGLPFIAQPNTTLNEKLLVQPSFAITSGKIYPKRRYLGVGIGGHQQVMTPHGIPIERHNLFEPYFSQLFQQVPWVVREPHDDITLEEKLKYRMRAVFEKDGLQRIGYYLRVMDNLPSDVTVNHIKSEAGVVTHTPFLHNATYQDILRHIPMTLANYNYDARFHEAMVVSASYTVTLTPDEINDLIASIELVSGAQEPPIISEIGIFAGIETTSNPILPTDTHSYYETDSTILSSYSGCNEVLTPGVAKTITIDLGTANLLSRTVLYEP